MERRAPQLDAAGRGREAGLAVRAHLAALVLVVVDRDLGINCLGDLVEVLAVVAMAQTQSLHELLGGTITEVVLPELGAQLVAQVVAQLVVGHALADLDGRMHEASRNRARSIVREHGAVALGDGLQRQEDVAGGLDGRIHERIEADAELKRLDDSVVPALGLHGGAAHEVVAGVEAHLDRIGLAGLESLQHKVGMRIQDEHAVCRVLFQADELLLQLVANALLEAEAGLVVASARAGQNLSTRSIQVASDGHQVDGHMALLHAVGLLVGSQAPLDSGRLGGRVHAGGLINLLDRNLADLGGLLSRHGGATLSQLLEAVAPVLDEVVVVQVFLDDDVDHCHAQRGVGAGAQLDVQVCASRQPGDARVDDDQTGAAAHGVNHGMAEEAVRVGLERSLAPNDQDLGQVIALVFPTAGQSACVVPLGIRRAGDVGDGAQTRRVARIAGLAVAEVRRAEAHRAVRTERAALAAGACEDDDALTAIGLGDAVILSLDDVEGLFPAALLPRISVTAILRVTLHGMDDTCGVVDVILQGDAPGAQTALGDRVVLVALDLDQLALVVDVELQAAAYRMASGRRPGARARYGEAVLLVTPRLSDVVHIGKGVELDNSRCLVEIVFPLVLHLEDLDFLLLAHVTPLFSSYYSSCFSHRVDTEKAHTASLHCTLSRNALDFTIAQTVKESILNS